MGGLLVLGIVLFLFGLFMAVTSAMNDESDPDWRDGVFIGSIVICIGISMIGIDFYMNSQSDPSPANHQSAHVEPIELPPPNPVI